MRAKQFLVIGVGRFGAARVMEKVGADEVVRPEHDMGVRVAKHLATPTIVGAFSLGDDYEVIEFTAQRKLCGTLQDLKLANRFGVQVIAVNRRGALEFSPSDNVVAIGKTRAVERLATTSPALRNKLEAVGG